MHQLTHAAAVNNVAETTHGPAVVGAGSPQGVVGVDSRRLVVKHLQPLLQSIIFEKDPLSGGNPASEALSTMVPYGVDGAGSRRRWWWLSCAVLFSAPPLGFSGSQPSLDTRVPDFAMPMLKKMGG